MSDLSIEEMQRMQKELHDKYQDLWGPICPQIAVECLLWTIGEVGEVIDVLKKEGVDGILENPATREHLTEEVSDVLMHLTDFLLCLNIKPEELTNSFRKKHTYNMERWSALLEDESI